MDCLRKIHERGGAIEISVRRPEHDSANPAPGGSDIVWRVKIVSLTASEVVVEPPSVCGANIELSQGVALIGAMTVGQNRWMFTTLVRGHRVGTGPDGQRLRQLVLASPQGVERCARRQFYRLGTTTLNLTPVQCWPLLNPSTVLTAETANRLLIERLLADNSLAAADQADEAAPESIQLPEAAPPFTAHLVNVSGGGLGLRILRKDAAALERRHFFWVRVDLRPHIPAPVAVTARLAHTHIDSEQNVYAGMAFDFAFNPAHRKFVLDLFTGYVARLQSLQRPHTASA
ncbi:MAG: hypothetical protein KF745_03120 [Phycisphaeraceae bacterium]|nr:hypothetical protein [Phycisphaeraceae bacterium]